jgi:hypothetical protein
MLKLMYFNKGETMYVVKLNNRKLTTKLFAKGFESYEAARNILRKYLRSQGLGRVFGDLGYSIVKS